MTTTETHHQSHPNNHQNNPPLKLNPTKNSQERDKEEREKANIKRRGRVKEERR